MAKVEKYDPYKDNDAVAKLVADYLTAENEEERADVVSVYSENWGKSLASIRQKLVREGVYVRKERTSKDGSEVVSKGKLVDQIAKELHIEFTESEATSLEKATKQTLKKILAAVDQGSES